jgi:phosphoribosylanthranilate isomerase
MNGDAFIVKICGLRTVDCVEAAVSGGASALGFMAYSKSKRFIEAQALKALLRDAAPGKVLKVGVFVDPSLEELERYMEAGLDVIQLHGHEDASFAEKAAKLAPVWKAFAPANEAAIDRMKDYPASRFLIDAFVPDVLGGAGRLGDWRLARYAVAMLENDVILAGGLKPENVADAVNAVKPAGVDVSSGVESAPGEKSPALIKAFLGACRNLVRQEAISKGRDSLAPLRRPWPDRP